MFCFNWLTICCRVVNLQLHCQEISLIQLQMSVSFQEHQIILLGKHRVMGLAKHLCNAPQVSLHTTELLWRGVNHLPYHPWEHQWEEQGMLCLLYCCPFVATLPLFSEVVWIGVKLQRSGCRKVVQKPLPEWLQLEIPREDQGRRLEVTGRVPERLGELHGTLVLLDSEWSTWHLARTLILWELVLFQQFDLAHQLGGDQFFPFLLSMKWPHEWRLLYNLIKDAL